MIPVKDTWKTILFNVLLYATIGILIGILRKISSDFFGNILLLILVSTSLLLPPISSFLYLDYSKMTIDDCDKTLYKIKNGYEQSSCYEYMLNYNKNPQLCRILDNSEKLYECYLMTARNLKDAQVCAQIFTEASRDDCFDIFSRNESNKESCLFIKNIEQRNSCQEDVEWLQQNS